MLIKIEDRKYRFVKNQYMSRRRRVLARTAPKLFCGLKAKTWASLVIVILTLAIIETPIITFGKTRDTLANTVKIQKVWAAKTAGSSAITKTPTKEDIIYSAKHGDIIYRIWTMETSKGTATDPSGINVICNKKGMSNEFGYSPFDRTCFPTFKEAVARVDKWIDDHKKLGLAKMLCEYNQGNPKVSCDYVKNFLGI